MKSEVSMLVEAIRGRRCPLVLAPLCALLIPAAHATLLWDNPGTQLTNFNNGLDTVNLGPDAFPFAGTDYLIINVSTAGFLYLGTQVNAPSVARRRSCSSNAITLFQGSPPRVAPGWAYLTGGTVDFNQVSDINGTRTDITYLNPTGPNFQVQLYPRAGRLSSSYMTFSGATLGGSPALIGVTPTLPVMTSAVDFTTLGSTSTTSSSLYDYFQSTNGLDLSGECSS